MTSIPKPDLNWSTKHRILLIVLILILAALCSLFGLYKIFDRVTLMAEQPYNVHQQLRSRFDSFLIKAYPLIANDGNASKKRRGYQKASDAFQAFDLTYHRAISDLGNDTSLARRNFGHELERNYSAVNELEIILEDAARNGKAPDKSKLTELIGRVESDLSDLRKYILRRHAAPEPDPHNLWLFALLGFTGFVVLVLVAFFGLYRLWYGHKNLFEAVFDTAHEAMAITDQGGHIVYYNKQLARNWGAPATSRLLSAHLPFMFTDAICREIEQYLDQARVWSRKLAYPRDEDDSDGVAEVTVTRTDEGYRAITMRDVSTQQHYIALADQRLAAIEAAGEGIGIVDADGLLVYMNVALCTMLGIERDEADIRFYGDDWRHLFSHEGAAMIDTAIMPASARDGYWCDEITLYRRDATAIEVVMSLTRLPGGGMIGTLRDISARKRAEDDNRKLQQQIYQVQKLEVLGRLAGGIAHDFNNVLAAIMGYAEFLVEDLDPDTSQHRFARGIMQSGTQARNLIDQILTFSRRSEQPRKVVDVAAVLHETMDMLESGLPKSIAIQAQITPEKAYVYAGHVQLVQLFMNICVNSRDAIDDSNGRITIGLDMLDHDDGRLADMLVDAQANANDTTTPNIALQHPDSSRTRLLLGAIDAEKDYVHISIQDNGGGVPREVMERIFDPFFTTKDSESGTGLGMSIIHGIVSDLGGAMAIDSIRDAGTCVDVFLPACAPPLQDEAVESGLNSDEALADHLQGEIVVIDDDENVRIMLGHMLERRNISVTSFPDARDGLVYIQAHAHRIDCVITDYNMPDLTGLDIIDTLEEEYPNLPFVIVTGYNTEHLTHAMREYPGLCAIVHKPISTQELMAAIQRAVLTAPEDEYY